MNMESENGAPAVDAARHPIQLVVRRTGLSADVIRIWERRYEVVNPHRGAGGRRLYSDQDIRRLALLQKVTSAGRRISDVAQLDDERLQVLVNEDEQHAEEALGTLAHGQGPDHHVDNCLKALSELDPDWLRRSLAIAEAELPLPVFLEQVVAAFMAQIGHAWERGRLRISQEHMASVIVRHHLFGLLRGLNKSGPVIVLTTPVGQDHEIGALLAAVIAENEGWNALFLGANMPAAEIAAAASQAGARAVGLSLLCVADTRLLGAELEQLRLVLPEKVALIVGGAAVADTRALLSRISAYTPADLGAFREILSQLRRDA